MAMDPKRLGKGDALVVVDVQNDFCPSGALPVKEGDQVVAVLNRWIEAAREAGAPVIASRDWHPPDHISFEERGGMWPRHCVQGSRGAEFHPELELGEEALVVSKGADPDRDSHSAFDRTELAGELRRLGVRRVWVGGLAQDVCVRATVLDSLREGFETHLLARATRPVDVDSGAGERSLEEMRAAGVIIEE
jgi:nicotinamidase/pyrazinamidase